MQVLHHVCQNAVPAIAVIPSRRPQNFQYHMKIVHAGLLRYGFFHICYQTAYQHHGGIIPERVRHVTVFLAYHDVGKLLDLLCVFHILQRIVMDGFFRVNKA